MQNYFWNKHLNCVLKTSTWAMLLSMIVQLNAAQPQLSLSYQKAFFGPLLLKKVARCT